MMMMMSVTLLAVCCSLASASAPGSKRESDPVAEYSPAAGAETNSNEALMKWPFAQSAASPAGVPSARRLFGAYNGEATPTEAPSATPTIGPTEAPSASSSVPACDGTFVDFEGVDVITLNTPSAFVNLSDGSGVELSFLAEPGPGTASFVSSVSEAANISVAATSFTSGGVFATAGKVTDIGPFDDLLVAFVLFPELVCEISFGFAVDVFEPVDDAIQVLAGVTGEPASISLTAPADPGEFDRASGFVRIADNGTEFNSFSVQALVPAGDIRTIILDNLCFIPCEP